MHILPDIHMNKLDKIKVFTIGCLIVALTTGTSCFNKNEPTEVTGGADFGYTDPEAERIKLQQMISQAFEKAWAWQEDAYLFAVNVYYQGTRVSDEFYPIIYFASATDNYENDFYVLVAPDFMSLDDWGILPRSDDDIGEEFYEVYEDDWVYGYADAVNIAEENGGREFREKHNNYEIVLDLYKNYEVGLEWGVYYAEITDEDEAGERLNIYIDPVYGTVKEITT